MLVPGTSATTKSRNRGRLVMTASPRWPAWTPLAAEAAGVAVIGLALSRYPGNLHDPAARLYLSVLAGVLVCCLTLTLWALFRPAAGQSFGTLMGFAAAAAWAVEIWAGGPAMLDRSAERAIGGTFSLLAVVVTGAAGVVAGVRARRPGPPLRAGLFAGMVSGATLVVFAVVMTLTNLGRLAGRADYQRQFAATRGHPADMATFLVGDILAASIAHLVINLVLGLAGGAIGALLAVSARSSRGTPAPAR